MTTALGVCFVLGIFGASVLVLLEMRRKHLHLWLGPYLSQRSIGRQARREALPRAPIHVLFCMVDHFEPLAGPTKAAERERMRAWREGYPKLVGGHKDSDGRPPQHSWFYPGEAYDEECLDGLSELVRGGYGEIELHLHHGYDISERLKSKIQLALSNFSKHGALILQGDPPKFAYGFIHGNGAFDNSMGHPSLCGVNDEITLLRETGCYADFSLPTAPAVSQTKKVNAIYYATDDPERPKSHDTGVDVEVGRQPSGDLMIIPGPLGFNWHNRKWGIIPRIENSEIQASNPPTLERVRNWVRQHIHVKGRPEWVFVKVSCHGAEDRSREAVLGDTADRMYSDLENEYRGCSGYRLHYVTAREMYNVIKASEAGKSGDPTEYYDYVLSPYRTHSDLKDASVKRVFDS